MKINLLAILLVSSAFSVATAQTQLKANDKATLFENSIYKNRPMFGNSDNMSNRRRYATCANRPGVVQLGIGYNSIIGGAHLTVKDSFATDKEVGVGVTYNLGLRAQIGISEVVSLGFYVRKEVGVYTNLFSDFTMDGMGFGFEGKVYPINNDRFAVYVAPAFGYTTANSVISSDYDHKAKGTGLTYGFGAGLNWYWTNAFGMSFDIGYQGSNISGKFNETELKGMKYGIKYGGLSVGLGLVIKFDGVTFD